MDIELDPEQDDLDYWRAYGLDCDPFADQAIEGLYFPGGDRGELLQTAIHIAQFSRLPVVFYGAEGVGKTSLLNAIADGMDNETLVLKLQAGFMTTREQIFAEIAHALAMSDVNYIPAAFRQQIVTALAGSEKPKSSVLLLVDDAHELIDKTLHALRELAEEDSADVRVLFFAATDGNGFLRPELDRSDVQQLAIQPLDLPGIEAYLSYRLGTAGYDGEFPYNAADLDSILNQSLGIPARIGRIAEQKLRHKTRIAALKDSSDKSSARRLPLVHKLLIALLLALIAFFIFWGRNEPAVEAPSAIELGPPNPFPEQNPESPTEEPPVDTPVPDTTLSEESLPEPEPEPVISVADAPTEAAPANETTDSEFPVQVEERGQPSSSAFGLSDFERELLRANPEFFALQLLSSNSEAGMRRFAEQNARHSVRFYARVRNGQEVYVAVLGEFPSRQAAQEAVRQLPAELAKQKPWPRSISSIQTEIRDARIR